MIYTFEMHKSDEVVLLRRDLNSGIEIEDLACDLSLEPNVDKVLVYNVVDTIIVGFEAGKRITFKTAYVTG